MIGPGPSNLEAFDVFGEQSRYVNVLSDLAHAHLAALGLPTHVKDVPGGAPGADALMDLIAQDKKVKRGTLTFILVRGIGQAFIENNVGPAEVRTFIDAQLSR